MEIRFTIQSASTADRPAIISLLEEAGLPTRDLPDSLEHFLVGKVEEKVIGTVGLELLGGAALLRSLAVVASRQGTGLGKQLYQAALAHAADLGMESVYLITTTADRFFEKQGFQRIERITTPAAVQATAQFSGVCPSSAIVMEKALAH
jgi:amino-acid N-acetyltransferase